MLWLLWHQVFQYQHHLKTRHGANHHLKLKKRLKSLTSLKPPTIRDFTNPAFFDVFFFSALKSEKKMWHRFQSGFRILATPQERKWKCLLNLNHAEWPQMALDYQIAQLLNSLLWEWLAPCSLHTTVYKRQSQDGKRYSSSTTTLRGTIAFSFRLFSFNLGVCYKPKKKWDSNLHKKIDPRKPQTPVSKVNNETGFRIPEFHSTNHKLVGDFLPRSMQVDASFSKGWFFSKFYSILRP